MEHFFIGSCEFCQRFSVKYSLHTEFENSPVVDILNPIRHGGMMPLNVFDHCAQMLRRTKLKLGDF